MEYLDILDSEGNSTGKIASRDEAHQKGLWHKSVHVWIANSHKQLLIQKRTPNCKNYPNLWDVSCAGHIEAGSNSPKSAIREAQEELGLEIQKIELKYLFTIELERVLKGGTYFSKDFCDIFIVHRDAEINDFKLQKEEVSEVKWINIEELKELHRSPDFVPREEEYEKLFNFLSQENL